MPAHLVRGRVRVRVRVRAGVRVWGSAPCWALHGSAAAAAAREALGARCRAVGGAAAAARPG
eukprot:scaffold35871_cov32-Phaeocystis_antarctica.AAC.1